jgi:FKBP-type peptidyl-prolyl cis-trans isomerase FkpA
MMKLRMMMVLPALAFAACSAKSEQSGTGNSLSQSTADTLDGYARAQRAFLEQLSPAQGWQRTPSGLRYRRVSGTGQGPKPTVADTIAIHYSGKLTDGTQFDATDPNGPPATFPLGRLIQGWQEGIPLMSVGDTYEFVIPSELGYGSEGGGSEIPPDSTLLFTVHLVSISGR